MVVPLASSRCLAEGNIILLKMHACRRCPQPWGSCHIFPTLCVWDPQECRGGIALPPSSGPPRRHVAARCDPGRDSRAVRARRGVSVPFVARPAAAGDAPAEASARGAQRRSMFQAESALSATDRTWPAAALHGAEWDAPVWRLWGPPGIRQ